MQKVRSARNYDRDAVSLETGLVCLDKTRTQQSFKEECDINTLVRRFGLTGHAPENVRMPTYGDFTGLSTYQEAANALVRARESFDEMPSSVRARFNNDPEAFVGFCSDEKNREEAIKLGLVPPPAPVVEPVVPEPTRVVIVDPEAGIAPPKGGKRGGAQSST